MQYPIQLRFKIAAIASQIYATDNSGASLFYVKQKLFKLRENIEVYRDNTKSELLYTIKADKIIDFSPTYTLTDSLGQTVGSIKRRGARSILKASYDLELGSQPLGHVHESNPWIKVADAFLSEIPVIGLFAGYLFHPKYVLEAADGSLLALLKKEPAFLEGKFTLESDRLTGSDEKTQQHVLALLMIVVLLERIRG